MRIFHCDHCRNPVHFENYRCLNCGHFLAYLPDLGIVVSLDTADNNLWSTPAPQAEGRLYRTCANTLAHQICNWAVPADDSNPLCESCRLTRVIPDLTPPANHDLWYRLETAKRRLLYNLHTLHLPVAPKTPDNPGGLSFDFLADATDPSLPHVMTGHDEGLITLSLSEADDVERHRRQHMLGEPFRTVLGHFRHEIGHYYWDRLVRDHPARLERVRAVFGDDSTDYDSALRTYYANGATFDWQNNFVSAYASCHPWEDWAETWAHYLHMVDVLEIADDCGITIKSDGSIAPASNDFDTMIARWIELTHVLNNLNRGLGQPDSYPFVLSIPVVEKLRLIHDIVSEAGANIPPSIANQQTAAH
jgi:hypothetical protein